jgi:hypothetical protein
MPMRVITLFRAFEISGVRDCRYEYRRLKDIKHRWPDFAAREHSEVSQRRARNTERYRRVNALTGPPDHLRHDLQWQ